MDSLIVSTIESRAAEAAVRQAAAQALVLAYETATYVPPTVTAEDDRVWAAVVAISSGE